MDECSRSYGPAFKDEKRTLKQKDKRPSNIVLVGFMGVGKDTVGKVIAQKIGFKFLSTDELIVKKAALSLSQIIDNKGESYLHELEKEVLEGIITDKKARMVVSTGGEIVSEEKNCELIKNAGLVVYLSTKSDEIFRRMLATPNKRPQFKLLDPDEISLEINKLMLLRKKAYESIADVTVNAYDKSPLETAEEVIDAWEGLA
jgi:shikimate kinase